MLNHEEDLSALSPKQQKEYIEWREDYDELAKDLAVAYIKYHTAVTFPTAVRNCEGQSPGSLWVSLAEIVQLCIFNQEFQVHLIDFLKVLRTLNAKRGN